MGFFDNIFGGMFDFNKDGKTSIGESFIGYNIMNEVMKDDDDSDADLSGLGYDWRDDCEEGYDYGIDPYDYDTLCEYQEAVEEAKGENDTSAEFSISYDGSDKPSYVDGMSQNFDISIYVDNDTNGRNSATDILRRIYEHNKEKFFTVWEWCIDNVGGQYEEFSGDIGLPVTEDVLLHCGMTEGFMEDLSNKIISDNNFGIKLFDKSPEFKYNYGVLLGCLIKKNEVKIAKKLFEIMLTKNPSTDTIIEVVDDIFHTCYDYMDIAATVLFYDNFFNILKSMDNSRLLTKILYWEKVYCDYIEDVSRRKENEIKRQERAENNQHITRYRNYTCVDETDCEEIENDKTIYTYVGVAFPETSFIYHYLTDDDSIQIGDKVVVPVGSDNEETEAEVVSIGKHLRKSAPYPVNKTKKIIRKNKA